MPAVIELENVSKRFFVQSSRPTLFQVVRDLASARGGRREHWALRDVSLGIQAGERVGLVGRNGSGKTTLLRIMARVYEPTSGNVRVRGDVAGFLQVGAGMHRDLSAVDNAYLFGAVMGLRREEVRARLGDIARFAELEGFMDAPLREYSVGMVQRLGLALMRAADLNLLLLDELLGGADARFAEKMLRALEEYRGTEKTLVLCTHDPATVRRLCTRAILIEEGRIVADGPPDQVLARYERAAA